MWEFVDKVIYINLDKRTDRAEQMKTILKEAGIPEDKIVRFSAISDPIGVHGCVKSHIGVLKLAKLSNWNRILILEDDIEWVNFEEGYQKLVTLIGIPNWDVCMLGGIYVETGDPKIVMSFCTHAYMVNSHYYDKLIDNYSTGLLLRIRNLSMPARLKAVQSVKVPIDIYNIDSYWIKLQLKDNWIGVIPSMCNQIESYSDIENKVIHRDIKNIGFKQVGNYYKPFLVNNLV
jgi:glycosyl transferase, family 25